MKASNEQKVTLREFCQSTQYAPIDLVAPPIGHTNSETTKKHYAEIIPQDRPNMARIISDLMKID